VSISQVGSGETSSFCKNIISRRRKEGGSEPLGLLTKAAVALRIGMALSTSSKQIGTIAALRPDLNTGRIGLAAELALGIGVLGRIGIVRGAIPSSQVRHAQEPARQQRVVGPNARLVASGAVDSLLVVGPLLVLIVDSIRVQATQDILAGFAV
jgi:hypothetical protein